MLVQFLEHQALNCYFRFLLWTSQLPRFVVILPVLLLLCSIIQRILWPKKGKLVPHVLEGLPFFGQMFQMLKGSPWDTMAKWALEYGTIYKLTLFGSEAYVVSDPTLLKVVLNSRLSVFKKDTAWTYKPFLVILGNGLVTADGHSWRKQRNLLSHHLRVDILNEIPRITFGAIERLTHKLERIKRDGTTLEMAEEFRQFTLQVISEAILSLSAEESDETFAPMYLPISKSFLIYHEHSQLLQLHLPLTHPLDLLLTLQWKREIYARGIPNACTYPCLLGFAIEPMSKGTMIG